MPMDVLRFQYRFRFPDGRETIYPVDLDARSLDLINTPAADPPDWVRLDYHQCPICPLEVSHSPLCPAAHHLVDLIGLCRGLMSYDEVYVEVTTPERTVSKSTTAQRAMSSLMGLIIPTSGCPHTRYFKPMARFHLPLASEEETIYRASSMYLLAQYFVGAKMGKPDGALAGLKKMYENIHAMNLAMTERFRAAMKEDSAVNALILLDLFAKSLPYAIEDSLEELRFLFDPYLDPGLP